MKQNYLLFLPILLLLMIACKDDNESSYPASADPEINVKRNELYSVPNRKFVITADLKDDLGLKSLLISIPELYLEKEIEFSTKELMTEYNLAYEFLAPADTKVTDTFKVNLLLSDVSGNSVSKELTLYLDGDFNAPVINNVKPTDGSVIFQAKDMKLDLSFDVEDVTGIDSVIVRIDDLDIDTRVKVGGAKEYVFHQVFSIPSDLKSYQITITTLDTFVEPNKKSRNIKFSVANGLSEMYLADVPVGTDLTEDILGVPMCYHKKKDGVFTFKYYADCDNKEIYFLGQAASFEPHCFGAVHDGKLENNTSARPVILPRKGYYELSVDISTMSYTAVQYIPASTVYDPTHITICGNGMMLGGWDPNNTDLLLSANPDNPYQLERTLTLTGDDVAITVTSPGWGDPFWRLDENGIIVLLGGANFSYKGAEGNYKFRMDTELERAVLVKE